jgi:undecaprenyl diphosphate synthase
MNYKENIDKNNIPKHVAVIMDGNGRWAKEKGKLRVFGHRNGVKAVTEVVEAAAESGVQYLTLYAFSTENWNRPKFEIQALMDLLLKSLEKELDTLMKNKVRLQTIGNIDSLPGSVPKRLKEVMIKTQHNDGLTLVLALSYSSKWETAEALKSFAEDVKQGKVSSEDITEETFRSYLQTADYPDPELMIRTSGEKRISNFLMWQLSYAELLFLDKYWPDFRREDFYQAIYDYQNRERRFGKTSEQLKESSDV